MGKFLIILNIYSNERKREKNSNGPVNKKL